MKILQINSVCGIGSTGRIATDIQEVLTNHGHESHIAYGRGKAENSNTATKIGNVFDVYAHVIKTRVLDKHGFGSKRATKKFIETIEELNPDVIHLHNIHGYFINIEILFKYLKKVDKPVVWTLHDCWPFTGHCAYFDYADCNCWKIDGNHKCIQKRSYPSSFLLNNSTSNYLIKRNAFTGVKNLVIVTPSNWLAGLVKESFLRDYPVKVINNGINLNSFKPVKSSLRVNYGLQNKFIILGVASTWSKRKGYNYFKELSTLLKENEIILLVGLSERQKAQLPSNIIGITRTNNIEELAEIYSSADVFLNPTLEDNFPTTNLEALACGVPIITFNTGGSGEPLTKDCGIIVEKGDITGVINAINKIKVDGKMKYFNHCLSRATYFDKEVRFNDYLKLYNSVYATSKI